MTASGNKTRFVLITPFYYPTNYGGAVQIYHNLLRNLNHYEGTVVTHREEGQREREDQFDRSAHENFGYRVERVEQLQFTAGGGGPFKRVLRLFRFLWQLRRDMRRVLSSTEPTVVVCGASYNVGWIVNWFCKSIPTVNYVHGEELTIDNLQHGVIARWTWRQQLRRMQEADMNIGVSEFTCKNLVSVGGADSSRVTLLTNFVDDEKFHLPKKREDTRKSLGWEGSLVFLCVARLVPRKGIDHAMRALAAADISDDWIFAIGGTGPEERNLKELAESLNVGDRIQFLGFIDDGDLAETYGAADVFLQPNREVDGSTEGFGVVFLEANACGLPVIGGRDGGTAGAIIDGETGFRVDGSDVSAVQSAIESLARDKALRDDMSKRGVARVRNSFTVGSAAREFETLLDDVRGIAQSRVALEAHE